MINTLADWVVTKMNTISDLNGQVYKYANDNPEFPCALVTFITTDGELSSLKTVYREYNFRIRIEYEVSSGVQDISAVETILYDLVDSAIDIFDQNRNADNNALLLDAASGEADWLDSTHEIRYCDITLTFRDLRSA